MELLTGGKSAKDALLAAGFGEGTAKHGMGTFRNSPALQKALSAAITSLPPSALPSAQQRATLVRFKLLENILEGRDKAVVSLKLAGQDRELNLWAAENQVGIVVIQPSARSENMLSQLDDSKDVIDVP